MMNHLRPSAVEARRVAAMTLSTMADPVARLAAFVAVTRLLAKHTDIVPRGVTYYDLAISESDQRLTV